MDEILKEEIREYKETLTCPSCKVMIDLQTINLTTMTNTSASQVKRKDAILTKCFHAFCYDCLRTRYETRWKIKEQTSKKTKISIHRQRKCPKCNAAFGASDYHRCLNTCILHKYSSVFLTNIPQYSLQIPFSCCAWWISFLLRLYLSWVTPTKTKKKKQCSQAFHWNGCLESFWSLWMFKQDET